MSGEPSKYRNQRATRALIELGLTAPETKRLREIALAEWDGELARLCRYILNEYAPPEDVDISEQAGA